MKECEYLTYLDDCELRTIEIDSHVVHPDKSVILDVLLGKMPVFRYNIASSDLHRYLDEARGHVLGCQEECKKFVEGRRKNEY